jgi:hypothetical protein
VEDEDVARCISTSIVSGVVTGCTWSLYFDGSDVGLGGGNEDVDAFEILPDGSVLISADDDAVDVPVVSSENNEDLLRCVGSFGPATSCTWSMYFDGSDINLTSGNENVDGVEISGSDLYLSTSGQYGVSSGIFSLASGPGGGKQVWICKSVVTGTASSCPGGFSLHYGGSGLANDDLEDFALP